MLHLDFLMINNGGCDPFHYIKGNGGLGYKPNAHYMHGLGYDYYNNIDGSGFPRMIGGVISNEEEVRERIKELQSEKELEGQMDKIRKGISEIENNKYYDPDEEKKDLETLRELWEQANNKLVNVVIRDEKIKELQDKKSQKIQKGFFDTTVNDMLSQGEDDGYHYFQNQKLLHPDKTKNNPNGIAWENVQNEKENKKTVSRYTNDMSDIKPVANELEHILEPNDKYVEELLKRLGDNDLLPSQTIPFDSHNDEYFIEKKNYIHTKTKKGRKLDIDNMKNIFNLHRKGLSPEEIEQKYINEGEEIPTVLISEGKLTGLDKNNNKAPMYAKFSSDHKGNKYISEIMLHKNFIADKNNQLKYIPKNKPISIWEGKRGLIYDILLDNTRIIYNPLKDSNIKLKNNGSLDTSHYEKIKDNGEIFIKVPITRVNMSKIRI